jgi:hypothetical protein
MGPIQTQKQIEAFKLTADRLQNFLDTNQEIFGDPDSSPYGFIIFCSFLVVAAYAPSRKFFPNTLVARDEADTETFKQIVIKSIIDSLLDLHNRNLSLTEEENINQASEIETQVVDLLNKRYAQYYECFQWDVAKLATDQTNPYASLSDSFLSDVLGMQKTSNVNHMKTSLSLGLFLSTTISGLMNFFGSPEGAAH